MIDERNKPRSVWVSLFDTHSVQEFYDSFVDLENNPMVNVIPVFINSYGGEVFSYIAKRDLIKSSDRPVSTICMGKAMSCGAYLLAAGTKGLRFAIPDSRILIHQVSGGTGGKTSDIVIDAQSVQGLNEMIFDNLSRDTGISASKFKQEMRNRDNADWTLSAEEALKWGIIDKIGVPRHIYPPATTALAINMKKENFQVKPKKKVRK